MLLYKHIDNLALHGDECSDIVSIVLYSIQPIFSFYQLYITFKYSNVSALQLKWVVPMASTAAFF